jgi:hypothetical protein
MSTIKSSAENLTLNADGANNDIKFQSNGSEVASIDQAGTITATTFTGAATDATKLPLAGGSMTGALKVTGGDLIIDQSNNGYSGTRIHDDTGGDYNTFIDLGRNQGGTRLSIRAGGRTQGTSPWQNATPSTIVSFANEGIAFHGDTAAANTLDDYEEGTWTPRIKSNSGEGSSTAYQTQVGTYTKIGNRVYCDFKCDVTTEGSFSGSYLQLAGLPFAISSSVGTVNLGMLYFVGLDNATITLGLQAHEGQSEAYLWTKTSSSVSREYLGITGFGTAEITGQFTYKV